ncbi:MAG: AAA family ATPase [Gammaproteobacteria bacterium]|nr:AAA family ATPase [Gammaproteobacteria bacterium]
MYTKFFGLNEKPFSITPDPRYLFMSERHGEALAHLVYGVTESGGFIQLTGEVGTGKTTLVRTLLANRLPDHADVAVVLNPQQTPLEFLRSICQELHVELPADPDSIKALIDALNNHLLAAHADGRRVILVVDEAQNLRPEVLEEVRLLTNLETAKQKLLQIILIGQPELRELLSRTDLRQLAQRITARYHLQPLTQEETASYIEHRLKVAGALGEVFDAGAKKEVFRLSQGVPRLINVICDRALLGAYSLETRGVTKRLVRRAAAEISGEDLPGAWSRWAVPVFGAAGIAVVAAGIWAITQQQALTEPVAATPVAAAAETTVGAAAGTNVGAASSRESGQDAPPTSSTPPATTETPVGAASSRDPEPTLLEQLTLATDLTRPEAAIISLFARWGLEYDSSRGTGCAQAESAGYACLYQRGSWSGLRQFDRPAMLTLTDTEGNAHRVVLTQILGDQAELSIGGVTVTHPIGEISEFWFGQYMLLWRPPNGEAVALREGLRHENVIWLRRGLAAIDDRYLAEPLDSDLYDAELAARVRNFQRDNRIDVDGLAGQQTQIIVNSLLAVEGTPRLSTPGPAAD